MDTLLEKHKGLVYKLVHHLHVRQEQREEAINYGLEGLWKAVTRFDVARDRAFSTYALWWIRQAVMMGCFWKGANARKLRFVSLVQSEDFEIEAVASESEEEQAREREESEAFLNYLLAGSKLSHRDHQKKLRKNMICHIVL
jgi:RNA polymerase sigma factor (sigma-70 family)